MKEGVDNEFDDENHTVEYKRVEKVKGKSGEQESDDNNNFSGRGV